MDGKFIVLFGNFGSGKSELALHFALSAPQTGKTALVDLDIINPYFRSSDRKDLLQQHGVRLIAPMFAHSNVEMITLPPDVYAVFNGSYDLVVFDLGGDAAGAVALGQYLPYFQRLPAERLEVYLVVNPRRPLSATPEQIVALLRQMETACRLQATGLINNGNLSTESSVDDLLHAYDIIAQVSQETGLPVAYTAGLEPVIAGFEQARQEKGLEQRYTGQLLPLQIRMARDWQRIIDSNYLKFQ
ncbi:MAG: ParA family protein [Firmicutes bacterium]|nr:ParA family protein [Bacillota bacterium]